MPQHRGLLDFAGTRLEGTPGITAVLHTWGQKLNYHPHLHCILTAGALSEDATQWRRPKQQRCLFPDAAVGALSPHSSENGSRAFR
jgi:Putative transposase